MEKKAAAFDVDLEGWELLPDQGMLSIYGKGEARRSSVPKETAGLSPKLVDHFPDDPSQLLVESMDDTSKTKQQGPVDPSTNWAAAAAVADNMYPEEKIVTEVPPPPAAEEEGPLVAPASPRKFLGCCEGDGSEEEKEGEEKKSPVGDGGGGVAVEAKYLSSCVDDDRKEKGWLEGFGFSIWRWRLTGIGALCSIGVAAATICIFILGGRQRHKHHHQAEKIQFQIYDDKNLKQIVQHASRLNQAVSASRGPPPATRANISFGGHFDGLRASV